MIFIKIKSRGKITSVIDSEETLLKFLNDHAFKKCQIKCIRLSKDFLDIAHSLCGIEIQLSKLGKFFRGSQQVHIRETYRLRGYTEEEAQADILSRQPNLYDPAVYAKKRNVSIEQAEIEIEAMSRRSSRRCVEYWTHRGYSLADAIIKVSEVQSENSKKFNIHKKNNPEKYIGIKPNQVEYYIKRGYTLDEATQMVSERQATFSKKKCIEKYGPIEGLLRFQQRQDKWMKSLAELPSDEKDRIADAKVRNGSGGISKVERKFISKLIDFCGSSEMIVESQYRIRYDNQRGISTKVYDAKINDVLIEFHGDYFHANPKTFPNLTHVKKTPVEYIRQNDEFKADLAKKYGFRLFVVWESEFNADPDGTVESLISFIRQ